MWDLTRKTKRVDSKAFWNASSSHNGHRAFLGWILQFIANASKDSSRSFIPLSRRLPFARFSACLLIFCANGTSRSVANPRLSARRRSAGWEFDEVNTAHPSSPFPSSFFGGPRLPFWRLHKTPRTLTEIYARRSQINVDSAPTLSSPTQPLSFFCRVSRLDPVLLLLLDDVLISSKRASRLLPRAERKNTYRRRRNEIPAVKSIGRARKLIRRPPTRHAF